jgi:hypothetical protein
MGIYRPRSSTLRPMQLTAALAQLLCDPAEERHGSWSQEELEQMNAAFVTAVEQAFASGLESRESAAAQVALPASAGPRFIAPLCPAVSSGLLRSAENALAFVARR